MVIVLIRVKLKETRASKGNSLLFCFLYYHFFIAVLLIKLAGLRYLMVGKVNMLLLKHNRTEQVSRRVC